MKNFPSLLFFAALSCLLVSAGPVRAVDFKSDVQPILREKCFKCHSGPRAKGKLRYDEEKYLADRIGEGEGAVVVPGKPEMSKLIKLASLGRTNSDAMPPPNRGDGLTAAELSLIKRWIADGASLESGGASDAPTAAPATPESPKSYSWTNTKGQTLKAYFVRKDGRDVVLKKEDGTEFTYPVTSLDPASREQAAKLAAGQ